MNSVNLKVFTLVVAVVSTPPFTLADETEKSYYEELLNTYRLCLADNRGGIYWQDHDVNGISCEYITIDGAREVFCQWHLAGSVRITYQLDPNATRPPPRLPNCRLARRVEVRDESESFIGDFAYGAGPPAILRAPRKLVQWRGWIQWTSPLRITVKSLSTPLPSFDGITSLLSFSLIESSNQFPKYNDTPVFPELPSTVEELSLAQNALGTFRTPENNSYPSLKRLDLSHNELNKGGIPFDQLPFAAPSIEELDLSHNSMKFMLDTLWALCTKLRRLNLSHNKINGFSWTLFVPSEPTNLRFLNISHFSGENTDLFPFGALFPLLESVDVSYSIPSEPVNESRTWTITGPKMKRLYASGYDDIRIVGNVSLEYVRMKMDSNKFPNIVNTTIKHLDISGSKIRFISNMGLNHTSVEYLDISMNEIRQWTTENIFQTARGTPWVKHLNFSHNKIRFMSPTMLLSLRKINSIDLGANPFECNNCTVHYFQTWLKKNIYKVLSLNKSNTSPHCGSPDEMRHVLILNNEFYQKYCIADTPLVTGVSLGVIGLLLIAQIYVCYHFRHKIIFVYHMYRLRIQQTSEEKKNCTHDVFICYSSVDRAFVMNILAPFIEEGPERYQAYIHERSFILGCHIETNIVEAIEKSRRALLVVSQDFLKSEFCKKEFDMVTHRAFDGNQAYMVLLRFGPLRKESIPRSLRLYMTTKTYLEWPDDNSKLEALEVRKRLVRALGRSLYQRAHEEDCDSHCKQKPNSMNCRFSDPVTESISYRK